MHRGQWRHVSMIFINPSLKREPIAAIPQLTFTLHSAGVRNNCSLYIYIFSILESKQPLRPHFIREKKSNYRKKKKRTRNAQRGFTTGKQ